MGTQHQLAMPSVYKDVKLVHGYRIDPLVENKVMIEIKYIDYFIEVHTAQKLTFLNLGNYILCLLLNFNVSILKDEINRIIN